ncbi:thermonuclease family protein [Mycoplasmopsis gallinarum]
MKKLKSFFFKLSPILNTLFIPVAISCRKQEDDKNKKIRDEYFNFLTTTKTKVINFQENLENYDLNKQINNLIKFIDDALNKSQNVDFLTMKYNQRRINQIWHNLNLVFNKQSDIYNSEIARMWTSLYRQKQNLQNLYEHFINVDLDTNDINYNQKKNLYDKLIANVNQMNALILNIFDINDGISLIEPNLEILTNLRAQIFKYWKYYLISGNESNENILPIGYSYTLESNQDNIAADGDTVYKIKYIDENNIEKYPEVEEARAEGIKIGSITAYRTRGTDTPETKKANNPNQKLAIHEAQWAEIAKKTFNEFFIENGGVFYFKKINNGYYGRWIGLFFSNSSENLNDEWGKRMVSLGLSRVQYIDLDPESIFYAKTDLEKTYYDLIVAAQNEARNSQVGFWIDDINNVFLKIQEIKI